MGKTKTLLDTDSYLYNTQQGLPTWKAPASIHHAMRLRNITQHSLTSWAEDMPDLTGQALADAQMEFDFMDEADNMPLWIQLNLDLWEGQHGINEQTIWDVAQGGARE